MHHQVNKPAIGRINLDAFHEIGYVGRIESPASLFAESSGGPTGKFKTLEDQITSLAMKGQRTHYLSSFPGHLPEYNRFSRASMDFCVHMADAIDALTKPERVACIAC